MLYYSLQWCHQVWSSKRVFGYLPVTHPVTNPNKIHAQASSTLCDLVLHPMPLFMHVYLHAQTTTDASDNMHLINHGHFDHR